GSPAAAGAAAGSLSPGAAGGGGPFWDQAGAGGPAVSRGRGAPWPGSGARRPRRNRLYRNLGAGRGFEDVTDRAGVDGTRNGRKIYGIGCAVGDIDNDGFDDLLVTGFGGAILYRNNGDGTFTDITRQSGIQDT